MQSFTVKIEDSFVQDFLNIVTHYKDKIQLQKDENLEYDPYFYERKKELETIRDDIKSGKSSLISFEDFEKRIELFEKEIELKYAN
jgi:hypothetical protein